jgi:hypothetical protein
MKHFSITTTVIISVIMLLACSNKKNRNYRIITQQYIDSLDNAALSQQTDTTWQLILQTERILEQQIPGRYFETLKHYFTGTIANDEVQKFGYILIISGAYAFGNMSSSFKINDKPFYFISPPYYQLSIKSGRRIYFMDHNYHTVRNGRNALLGDTLIITLSEFFPTETDWEPYYRDKKSPVFSITYKSDSLSPRWMEVKREKIK